MQSLSQNRDGQNGGDCAAILACSTIRRNGNRHQTVGLVPRHYALSPRPLGRRPHWSATKVQTRLTAFRPVTCAPGSTRVSPASDELVGSGEITNVSEGSAAGVPHCADEHVGSSPVVMHRS